SLSPEKLLSVAPAANDNVHEMTAVSAGSMVLRFAFISLPSPDVGQSVWSSSATSNLATAPGSHSSPVPKPRLASAALHDQDKIAPRTPNRASYPSCDSDTPKLRWTQYPEQPRIAERPSHERLAAGRRRLVRLFVGAGRLLGVQGRVLVQSVPENPHLQSKVLRAVRRRAVVAVAARR